MHSTPTMADLIQGCEAEKLHLSGAIQPFGSLIGVHEGRITHASANCDTFLHRSASELLGSSLELQFPMLFTLLEEFAQETQPFRYQALRLDDKRIEVKISRSNEGYIFDIESYHNDPAALSHFDKFDLLFAPQLEIDLPHYYTQYVKSLARLSGYDRVMLYQFQEDFSGKVIAEATVKEIGSYMNLRFPSSDIPKIARDLYMLNPSRTICNTEAPSVPILALDDTPIDLTYSDTRSVSPVHVQYLQNMGIHASFSIPIIISGELWGLLAAHHLSSKHLASSTRHQCSSLTKTFELGLKNFYAIHKMHYYDEIEFLIGNIINSIEKQNSSEASFSANAHAIMNLVGASGFIYLDHHTIFSKGTTPNAEAMEQIDDYFLSKPEEPLLHSNALMHDGMITGHYLGPLGVLGAKVLQSGRYKRCYWFRDEVIEAYEWAGNPNKPVVENAGALMLSPRRSFEKWIEERRGYAKSFNSFERSSAMKFLRQLSRLF